MSAAATAVIGYGSTRFVARVGFLSRVSAGMEKDAEEFEGTEDVEEVIGRGAWPKYQKPSLAEGETPSTSDPDELSRSLRSWSKERVSRGGEGSWEGNWNRSSMKADWCVGKE